TMLHPVDMSVDYRGTCPAQRPAAYDAPLLGTMLGAPRPFMRRAEVEAAWELLLPILNAWQRKKSLNFPNYAADSWGPEIAEALIARDGFHWFTLPVNNRYAG